MRRLLLFSTAALVSSLGLGCTDGPGPTDPGTSAAAEPSQPAFITFGQPDAGRHPYVVFFLTEDADGQIVGGGTATLLSPTVVLASGHGTFFGTGARIWVGPIDTLDGEFPFGGENSYDGTAYAHPDFCYIFLSGLGFGCGNGVPNFASHDFGILVLSEPVPTSIVNRYAQLPSAGLVGTLANKTLLDIVGYGGTQQLHIPGEGGKFWDFPVDQMPFRATAEFISGNFVHSDEWIRHTTNGVRDNGAVCFGDSGGPTLLGGTDIVLGVASNAPTDFSHFGECTSVLYSGRTDRPEILSWIQGFMD
jgi:hypothetical protein